MTPQELDRLNKIEKKLDQFLDVYYRTHFIDKDVFSKKVFFSEDVKFENRKLGLYGKAPIAQQSAISAPSGGLTVDSPARTAINTIITTLQNLGITQ